MKKIFIAILAIFLIQAQAFAKNNSTFLLEPHAPIKLYKLIKLKDGLPLKHKENTMHILDLIWNEPNGRIMLEAIIKKRTKINITRGESRAKAGEKIFELRYLGLIPIIRIKSTLITLPYHHIENFNNINFPLNIRLYHFHVLLHEMGHVFMRIKEPKITNSLEEELGVSMIGFNIAHKIVTGEYLTLYQTREYSRNTVRALYLDDHKDLQTYSGFNEKIQSYGIKMPFPEIYSDIPSICREINL